MRRLFFFLVLLIASVWLGLLVLRHPGYLLVFAQPWMVQMPLWFALLASVVLLIIFYWVVDSIDRLQFLWFRLKNWLRFRREHRLYNKAQHGLMLLIEGRWQKSERLLMASMNEAVDPLINYLGAAKAAHEMGAYARRDQYIQTAYQVAPQASLAIGLTQEALLFEQGEVQRSFALLDKLRVQSPRHPLVLKRFEQRFCDKLRLVPYAHLNDLKSLWNSLPRQMRKQSNVACAYAKQLVRLSDAKEAESVIRQTLKRHWQSEMVLLYGTLPFVNLNRQLVIVGAWLNMYGERPETLLTLGRLCVRVQLWGKAKDYFARCLALGPNADASLAYGLLLEKLDEPDEAMVKYREGLVL